MQRSRETRSNERIRCTHAGPWSLAFSLIICPSINLLIYISTYLSIFTRSSNTPTRYGRRFVYVLPSFRNLPLPLPQPSMSGRLSFLRYRNLFIYSFIYLFSHRTPIERFLARVPVRLSSTCRPLPLFPVPRGRRARSVLLRARFIRRCTTGDERVSTRREGHERARRLGALP